MNYHLSLQADTFYYIFSRATGDEKLFRNRENYRFFLSKYQHYINPIADTYSYCLLPNHFHFLLRIKPESSLQQAFKVIDSASLPNKLMQPFSNLLNSYTKSFNKFNNRKGSLFMDYLRRVEVSSNEQLCAVLFYIHKNPVHHGYCRSMEMWDWSSYNTFLSTRETGLKRAEALSWFSGLEGFNRYHNQEIRIKNSYSFEH